MTKIKIIQNFKEVKELIKHCQTTGYCSFDYETTGLEYQNENEYPLILGVSFQPGSAWIIPLAHKASPFLPGDRWKKILRYFGKKVLENFDIVKVAWNFKFEYKWTMKYGIFCRGRLFDAMLAKYCLDEERPHGLKNFVENFLPMYAGYEKELKTNEDGEAIKVDWKNTPYDKLCIYCGRDSDYTLRGMVFMEDKLIRLKFYNLFRNMLMMILRVLAESEYRGMLIDRKYLDNLIVEYKVKLSDSDKKMRSTPSLLKYEKKHKTKHLLNLINIVQLEIAKITEEEPKNAAILIRNREAKIKNYAQGIFNNKERYEAFNFGSPLQLAKFLFTEKYGLKLPIKVYTDSGAPSTGEEALVTIKHLDKSGFIDNLLGYRTLAKLDSTYISGMHHHLDIRDRVHANFKINGTVTGRLSCVQPNLQNIPRGTTAADIKRMFIPPKGYVLLEVDYSQAELRIIAELSGDKAMIDIFKRNYNIHVATACKMSGKGIGVYDEVKAILKKADAMSADEIAKPENEEYLKWAKWKKRGKSMNFSIVYQQGDDATAEQMGITKEEAKTFKKQWFKEFPGVDKWIKKQKEFAHDKEYVYNMFGGKRRLYDINCGKGFLEAEAERQAVNAPVQGASGYFTLFSQVVIREQWLKGLFPRDMQHVYTVHDSIGYYIRPKDIHETVPKIVKICDNPETQKYFNFQLKDVVMKVSSEVGWHWGDLRDYDENINYNLWLKKKKNGNP